MPGMNSGLNLTDPAVVAAFKAALVHQGLIALFIFGLLGLVWITIRAGLPAAAAAGADTFVAGSAIFGSRDYRETIREMRQQIAAQAQVAGQARGRAG